MKDENGVEVEVLKMEDFLKKTQALGLRFDQSQIEALSLIITKKQLNGHIHVEELCGVTSAFGVNEKKPKSKKHLNFEFLDLESKRIMNRLISEAEKQNIKLEEHFMQFVTTQNVKTRSKIEKVKLIKSQDFYDELVNLKVRESAVPHDNLSFLLAIDHHYQEYFMMKKVIRVIKEFDESPYLRATGTQKREIQSKSQSKTFKKSSIKSIQSYQKMHSQPISQKNRISSEMPLNEEIKSKISDSDDFNNRVDELPARSEEDQRHNAQLQICKEDEDEENKKNVHFKTDTKVEDQQESSPMKPSTDPKQYSYYEEEGEIEYYDDEEDPNERIDGLKSQSSKRSSKKKTSSARQKQQDKEPEIQRGISPPTVMSPEPATDAPNIPEEPIYKSAPKNSAYEISEERKAEHLDTLEMLNQIGGNLDRAAPSNSDDQQQQLLYGNTYKKHKSEQSEYYDEEEERKSFIKKDKPKQQKPRPDSPGKVRNQEGQLQNNDDDEYEYGYYDEEDT